MIKGYIFDLDGTVLDSMGIWEDLGKRYLMSKDIMPEEGLNEKLFSMSLDDGCEYLGSTYHLSLSADEILHDIVEMIASFYMHDVCLKKDAKEVLKELYARGMKMTAATAGDRKLAEAALKRLGVFDCFAKIFTCAETGSGKEKPDIFLEAAEFMNLSCDECMVVEDSLTAMNTAHTAGFKVCAAYDRYGREDRMKMKEVSDLYMEENSSLRILL